MALIRSLMNADVEQDKRERRIMHTVILLAVFSAVPAAVFALFPPALIVWGIPGIFLVVSAEMWLDSEPAFGVVYWTFWIFYYLVTCAVIYGLARWITKRWLVYNRQ